LSGFKCPYCNQIMSLTPSTEKNCYLAFEGSFPVPLSTTGPFITITLLKCPNDACGKTTVTAKGFRSEEFEKIHTTICPPFQCIVFPPCVPVPIRQDYEEACAIKELSPKASAALSRRCLQGMIRDFWEISGQKNLHQEIFELKGKMDDKILDAILALKSIENIGVHPETDVHFMVEVEIEEAQELIHLVEFLINDWYVARENRNELIASITSINR